MTSGGTTSAEHRALGLRGYLILLLLLSALPAFVVTGYAFQEERAHLIADARADAVNFNTFAARAQENLIGRVEQLLITLSALPQVREPRNSACAAVLESLLQRHSLYSIIGLADLDGNVVCSGIPLAEPTSLADQEYFQQALETGRIAAGEYQIDPLTDRPALMFAYPLRDDDGNFSVIAFTGLKVEAINNLLRDIDLPEGATLTVMDTSGTVVGRVPDPASWLGTEQPGSELVRQALTATGPVSFEAQGLDGIERLYAFTPIGPETEPFLFVGVGIPRAIAFSEANRVLLGHLASLGLFMFLTIVVTFLGISRLVLTPFGQIVTKIQRLRAGEQTTRLQPYRGPNELQYVARAFDEMADSLEAREQERSAALAALEDARAELEQRVLDRTAELRTAEQAATRESDLLRAIIDNIPDAIYVKDRAGHYVAANQPHVHRMGLDRAEDILGKSDSALAKDPSYAEIEAREQRVIHSGEAVINIEETVEDAATGQTRWLLTTQAPLRDSRGEVMGIVGISRDITTRKANEDKISQLNEALGQRAHELEAVNKELEAFSYSISHDLRAPLRAMDGFSRILLEDFAASLPDEAQRYLRMVHENAQQMAALVDDLLSFSRLSRQPLNKQPVDPTPIVQRVLADLEPERANRHVEIRVDDLPGCEADPALLRQVYANLLSNALKFTRPCEVSRIHVGCQMLDGESVYFVRDNGAGFDMRYASKLFGVFQRLHRAEEFEGTGVGLAIVQRIIHRHGGRIWPESAPGQGTTFYFTIEGGA